MKNTRNGWVVLMDVYGFSDMLAKEGSLNLHKRLSRVKNTICILEKTLREINEVYTYLFSDTIILFFPVDVQENKGEVLSKTTHFIREVLGICLENDLCMRGSIAYGEVTYEKNLIIGTPIVTAYRYEQSLVSPVLFLPFKELVNLDFEADNERDRQIVILKDGTPIAGYVIDPYPFEKWDEAVKRNFDLYIVKGILGPAKAWYEAKNYLTKRVK